MKKKIFSAFFILSLIMTVCSATTCAKHKTELPVKMITSGPKSNIITLNKFKITNTQHISESKNKVDFEIRFTDPTGFVGYPSIRIKCYNEYNKLRKTCSISYGTNYINIPSDTALLEVTLDSPAEGSDSYIYKLVKMYALDGRFQYVDKSEVKENEKVVCLS